MRNQQDEFRDGGGAYVVDLHLPVVVAPPSLVSARQRGVYERWVKPLLDRAVGALLCVAAGPLLLVIAAAVYLRLGSPVLLRQARVGRDGQTFQLYKFRTMRPDRRRSEIPVDMDRRRTHKHPDDPRLVGLGRFLRRWSLDELPQLLNVVQGHMSLVGPRPELVSIVERHYQPWQHARHAVKPGLTGLWQVTERGDGEMHHHTHTDLRYLKTVSFRNDLRILLLTVPAVLGLRKGF